MIEYYLAMSIFLLLVVSIGYFMYQWYNVVQEVNLINLNTPQGIGEANTVLTAMASLHQPCVLKTQDTLNDTGDPVCDTSSGLTCITGMYVGNGVGSGTGVCLSNVGGYCDTIYDCVPSAQACVNSVCENMTETINLPCAYDSDCIGGATCTECLSGTGPCKDITTGECSELVNGECPAGLSLCDKQTDTSPPISNLQGEFRFNHICDTSLALPLCKYDFSPKDQGCTTDTDCIQPEGGAFCYTGTFKTESNPTGTLSAPEYAIKSTQKASDNSVIVNIDFGDALVTVDSFEKGTEVNFIKTTTTRTALSYGPYYIKEQFDNSYITLMDNKSQPNILEFAQFPSKYIQLNENNYYESSALTLDDISPVTVTDYIRIDGTVTTSGTVTYTIKGSQPDTPFTIDDTVTITYNTTDSIKIKITTVTDTQYTITGSQPPTPFTDGQDVNIEYNTTSISATANLSGGTYTITGTQKNPQFTEGHSVTITYNTSDIIQATVSNTDGVYTITAAQPPRRFLNNKPVNIETNNYNIVFGKLPPLQIATECYWDTDHFVIVDTDKNFVLSSNNVEINKTQVRFNTTNDNFQKSPIFILSNTTGGGQYFTVTGGDTTPLEGYDGSNTIKVQFGLPTDIDILNANKGVCVMKLPPSASIKIDSKYDLTEYIGNPCIDLYDNSMTVEARDGYCKFQNTLSGPGSVCQFSRPSVDATSGTVDPLPCSSGTTTYEGISYDLTCLIDDSLTETVRNNPNFLNSSYVGVCAYPVHNKFKSCELYNNNCMVPYVCTEFEGGFFCDSRFDILQCNGTYGCPPDYECSDGMCLGSPGTGLCVADGNCSSTSCNTSDSLVLGFYNSILDTKTSIVSSQAVSKIPNQIVTLDVTLTGTIGSAQDYDLYVSSKYDNNNLLTTYAFVHSSKASHNQLIEISDPLGTPSFPKIPTQPSVPSGHTNFIFDDFNQKLYSYSISTSSVSLSLIYGTPVSNIKSSFTSTGTTVLKIDINNGRLIITSSKLIPQSSLDRPVFINTDIIETNYNLFQTIGDGDFYKSINEELTKLDFRSVEYYTSMPSTAPSQNYIVNNPTTTTDNGYYTAGTKTAPAQSTTTVYIVQGSETSYYIFNGTTFDSYQLNSVTLHTPSKPTPPGDYIQLSTNSWYYGGTTTKKPISTPTDPANQQKNEYIVDLYETLTDNRDKKSYTLPYFLEELDSLDVCKFDLLNVNDTEMDVVCVYNPENFESPVLGVRHKVREFSGAYFSSLFPSTPVPSPSCNPAIPSTNDLGCFLNPTISSLTNITTPPTGIPPLTAPTTAAEAPTTPTLYQVTNPVDVNTIYAFSNQSMTLNGKTVNKIYKSKSTLYLELSGSLGITNANPVANKPTILDVKLTPTLGNDYAPFSFSPSSNLDNYGNVMSKYLEYPYWIDDLQDLIVGDNFNPKIKRIFYQPDRVNKNFYAIVDMYTGYNDPVENKLIEELSGIESNNTYLFKFSSLDNEMGLTVNETLPIRINGPGDTKRFSQCNQTQNMFFLSNQCSKST